MLCVVSNKSHSEFVAAELGTVTHAPAFARPLVFMISRQPIWSEGQVNCRPLFNVVKLTGRMVADAGRATTSFEYADSSPRIFSMVTT